MSTSTESLPCKINGIVGMSTYSKTSPIPLQHSLTCIWFPNKRNIKISILLPLSTALPYFTAFPNLTRKKRILFLPCTLGRSLPTPSSQATQHWKVSLPCIPLGPMYLLALSMEKVRHDGKDITSLFQSLQWISTTSYSSLNVPQRFQISFIRSYHSPVFTNVSYNLWYLSCKFK